ncbi:TPA: hypothetical protein DIV55_03735 [Patescibacteria group bacterium]|nr:hypothetical protein [Patescibacteria group bacterium]
MFPTFRQWADFFGNQLRSSAPARFTQAEILLQRCYYIVKYSIAVKPEFTGGFTGGRTMKNSGSLLLLCQLD